MKKFSSIAVMLLVSMVVYTCAAQAGVGVRVWGGIGHIGYGNYNDWVDAFNREMLAGSGYSIDNMNWIPEFGGEVLFSAIPLLDIGVGASMMQSTSELSISEGGEFSIEHKLKSYPITATAYFKPTLPLAFMKPVVYGGVGLYRTVLTWDYAETITPESWDAELSKWGFGMHGGVGMEISVMPMMSIDLGVRGRWAKMKGFEGTATHSVEGEMDVFLAYDEGDLVYGPEDIENPENYDEGEVDLSGFGFILGLKLMF